MEYKYRQKTQRGKTIYQKYWKDPKTGKEKTKNVTDQEYFKYLKTRAEELKKSETVEIVKEIPKDIVTVDPKTGRRSKSQDIPEKPVIEEDGEITEILGRVIKIKAVDPEDGNRRYMLFDIEDLNGKVYKDLYANSKTINGSVRWICKNVPASESYAYAMETDLDELQKHLNENMNYQPYRLFRCQFNPETGFNSVFANVSLSWQKIKIKDLMPTIRDVFNDTNAIVKPYMENNGKHGGVCTIEIPGLSDLFNLNFRVDAGLLDGFHSAKVSAGCTILYCLNQLTFPSSQIPGLENIFRFDKRRVHSGSTESFRSELEETFMQAKKDIFTMLEASKKAKLTIDQQKDILTYFVAKNRISSTDYDNMVKLIEDKEIAQVTNTMYGLAMVISNVGTHHEKLTEKKRNRLALVAGELFIVSKATDKYLELIEPTVKIYREEEARKKQEREAKSEAAKKAAQERQAEREAKAEV